MTPTLDIAAAMVALFLSGICYGVMIGIAIARHQAS